MRLLAADVMQLKTLLPQGTPDVEIVRIAEAHPCDLIVTGTAVPSGIDPSHSTWCEWPMRFGIPISASNLLDW